MIRLQEDGEQIDVKEPSYVIEIDVRLLRECPPRQEEELS